jgi:hypothetical protein
MWRHKNKKSKARPGLLASDLLPHLNPRIIFDIFLNRKPRIRSLEDMNPYDFICVGTPNWYG